MLHLFLLWSNRPHKAITLACKLLVAKGGGWCVGGGESQGECVRVAQLRRGELLSTGRRAEHVRVMKARAGRGGRKQGSGGREVRWMKAKALGWANGYLPTPAGEANRRIPYATNPPQKVATKPLAIVRKKRTIVL